MRARHFSYEGFWQGIPQERQFIEEVWVHSVNRWTLTNEFFALMPSPNLCSHAVYCSVHGFSLFMVFLAYRLQCSFNLTTLSTSIFHYTPSPPLPSPLHFLPKPSLFLGPHNFRFGRGNRSLKNCQYSTEGQKCHQNLAPVLVIILWNSLAFSMKMITSTDFTGTAPRRASTSSGKNQSPKKRNLVGLGCWRGFRGAC